MRSSRRRAERGGRRLRDQVLLRLMHRHGLRASEAKHTKWTDFDLTPGSGPKTFHVRRLKSSIDSVHTLDRDEVSALRKLKANSTSPFVFISERGGPLSPDMIARIVERAAETAKLGFHVHPHMLRHATGYALANEGTDTRLIQDFLDHASIANTVRYTPGGGAGTVGPTASQITSPATRASSASRPRSIVVIVPGAFYARDVRGDTMVTTRDMHVLA
jgi:type 1 fimbriae regulatory protein FimB/type 1 fimbriae regulatory protein FimE